MIPYPDCFELSDGFLLHSPAKVNLKLAVLGRRADGYHELETVFQEVEWYDELEFRPSSDFTLKVRGATLANDDTNLVVRAARLLAQEAGVSLTGALTLCKKLPLQGGVGGGSSNASVALIGLNRLWGLAWPRDRLLPLARYLGADCPFFLHGGLAHGTGRGDLIEPLVGALPGWLVLVVPPFGVNTAEMFSQFRANLTEVERNVIFNPLRIGEEGGVHLELFPRNDLENIVFQLNSELLRLRDSLLEAGALFALLSGSGSTVFGAFESRELAERAEHLLARNGSLRVTTCRAVARR